MRRLLAGRRGFAAGPAPPPRYDELRAFMLTREAPTNFTHTVVTFGNIVGLCSFVWAVQQFFAEKRREDERPGQGRRRGDAELRHDAWELEAHPRRQGLPVLEPITA